MATQKIPHGLYGAEQDGMLDPDRPTPLDRRTKSTTRLAEERTDGELKSPYIAALRAAAAEPPPTRKPPVQRPVFAKTRDQAAKG